MPSNQEGEHHKWRSTSDQAAAPKASICHFYMILRWAEFWAPVTQLHLHLLKRLQLACHL